MPVRGSQPRNRSDGSTSGGLQLGAHVGRRSFRRQTHQPSVARATAVSSQQRTIVRMPVSKLFRSMNSFGP
jgi:hypothetical protein